MLQLQHQTPLFSLNPWLPATIAMAGDGKHLAVVMGKGNTQPLYGLAEEGAQIRYYSINSYTRTPKLVKTENVEGELLVNSAEWDADHVTLCYATMDVFDAYKLHRSNAFGQSRFTYTDVLPKPASLARGADHRLFANALGLANLYELSGDQLLSTNIGVAGTVVNGTMPYQHQLIFDKEKEEQNLYARELGNKLYEITDHLGNVRATITDKLAYNGTNYEADLTSSSTYYPFGMSIGTLSDISDYRFGFNGKEKDQNGEFGLTTYDYGFRIYNPSLGKFLSVDPLTKTYPFWSPYAFAGNTPIQALDLDGLEILGYRSMFEIQINKSKAVNSHYIQAVSGSSLYKFNQATSSRDLSNREYTRIVFLNMKEKIPVMYQAEAGSPNQHTISDPLLAYRRAQMSSAWSGNLQGDSKDTYSAYDANYSNLNRINGVNATGSVFAAAIVGMCKAIYHNSPESINADAWEDYKTQVGTYQTAYNAINIHLKDKFEGYSGNIDTDQFRADIAQYLVDGNLRTDGKFNDSVVKFGEYVKTQSRKVDNINLDSKIKRKSNRKLSFKNK